MGDQFYVFFFKKKFVDKAETLFFMLRFMLLFLCIGGKKVYWNLNIIEILIHCFFCMEFDIGPKLIVSWLLLA